MDIARIFNSIFKSSFRTGGTDDKTHDEPEHVSPPLKLVPHLKRVALCMIHHKPVHVYDIIYINSNYVTDFRFGK